MTTATIPAREIVREAIEQLTTNGRKTTEPTSTNESVTPAKAEKWLARNRLNRPLRNTLVQHYATEMRNGRWELNGETVKFDIEGNLIDGQHRLYAVILSGATVRMVVVRGVKPEAMSTLDGGARRTGGDYLALIGETDTNHLATALGHLARYERGDLWAVGGAGVRVTNGELEDTLRAHPGIRESMRHARPLNRTASVGMFAFLHYAFSKKDAALADWFIDALARGEGLNGHHAVYHLREILLRNLSAKVRMHRLDIMRIAILAWNKHRADQRCRLLRVPAGNPEIE